MPCKLITRRFEFVDFSSLFCISCIFVGCLATSFPHCSGPNQDSKSQIVRKVEVGVPKE